MAVDLGAVMHMLLQVAQVAQAVAQLPLMVLAAPAHWDKVLKEVTHPQQTKEVVTLAQAAVAAHKAKAGTEIVFHLPTVQAAAAKVRSILLMELLNFMRQVA
jgi:hypothetical protein